MEQQPIKIELYEHALLNLLYRGRRSTANVNTMYHRCPRFARLFRYSVMPLQIMKYRGGCRDEKDMETAIIPHDQITFCLLQVTHMHAGKMCSPFGL